VKLNKYQRTWINRLKSGETKKAKGELIKNGGSMCCLGVAIKTMQPLSLKMCQDNNICTLNMNYFPEVYKNLCLRSDEGVLHVKMIKPKWIKIIEEATDRATLLTSGTSLYSLTLINDNTSLTHVQIGEFIDQNREAVFIEVV
jgi:hypothetical protein